MNSLHNLTYFDIYEKNARYKGSSCALHFKAEDTTYSDLFLQTAKFANGLKRLNLPTGSRIAVLCKNHPAFFTCLVRPLHSILYWFSSTGD